MSDFFFFKQKTAYDMRISDWTSDVCSSDLYAASFGNHNASDGLDSDWADKLRNFAGISVRDENSRQLIRDALGQEPALVLDPCLQFPAEIQTPRSGSERPYVARSEEHTSELQSLMRISYAVFCLKKQII